jgi:putative hydrolase of the HAD superfamily
VRGRCDLKEAIAPHAVDWGWRGSVDDLLDYWFRSEHVVSTEALQWVRSLRKKGHRCVLGTNQEKYRTDYLRTEMRLAGEFDQVFASCELGAAKPAREFFLRIEDQLRLPSGALCLVDDSEKNVVAARNAGWRGVWYRGIKDLAAIDEVAFESHQPDNLTGSEGTVYVTPF